MDTQTGTATTKDVESSSQGTQAQTQASLAEASAIINTILAPGN